MVMRETSGFSVRPTVSESILNARRRNNEATRVSTPGLFSTCTTNVFSIVLSRVRGRLNEWVRTSNHFMQTSARRDHGVNRIFLLHLKVDQHGSLIVARHIDRGHNFRALRYGQGANSKGVRELHKIGAEDR